MLSIYLDKSCSMWKVRKMVEDHNHPLIPLKLVHQIPNHRTMTDADKAQVDSMHRHGLPPSKIMGLIAGQAGGYEFAGFTKKDLDNYIERNLRSKIIEGDVNATLNYLHGKAEDAPMMIVRHSLTDDDKLEHLFWADDLSLFDYQYFGDVLAFDSTYRKNKYNRPLVIFSATNHHRQTCIFGFGLLADEQTKSYKWLLDNFSEAMMNKHPSLVITDGDNAMKSAIEEVFPNATHRLCAWHLYKNAVSHIKDPEFREKFKKCLYAKFECDEFEEYWHDMVERFNLVGNDWVEKQYRRKEQWATAYLSSKFCAGFRTTSRCEGINSFIKSFVDSRDSILALVQNLERALRDYRNNEIVAEFETINGEHVPTTGLHSLERHAASVYTREIFWEILEEIKSVAALDIVSSGSRSTTTEYKIIKYGRPDHEYIVLYDQDTQKMVCQCQRWDSYGIPCSHMFCVMKREQIKELPETLILKRWTKDVKKIDDDQGNINGKEDEERSILMRIGALSVASSRMIYLGGRKLSHFRYTMNEICRVTNDLEAKLEQTISPEKGKKVGDPSVAKSKGAPKVRKDENKRRQCSNCNQTGHTKRKCIERTAEKDVQHNDRMFSEDEFEDGVESVSIPNDQTQ
ncbi:protein FAR1-RELATED SEQUENCE 5-like isoform X2 [Arachis hypogaea]|uniref:protein FAR1-RELATED SEQUENCE 5-like isoform X2 n=1 Tax=Arachis hypogaea TaxID=3818 RepID=UPI003B21CCFE